MSTIEDMGEDILYSGTLSVKQAVAEGSRIGKDFHGANLRGADLSEVSLIGVRLASSNLIEADLSDAILVEADLNGADLTGANLRGTDLTDSYLRGANLEGANLEGAYLPFYSMASVSWTAPNLITIEGTTHSIPEWDSIYESGGPTFEYFDAPPKLKNIRACYLALRAYLIELYG
jgi:hypothetical protein